ncbi:MAG: hypothetical protein LIP01_12495, partial [Tannerellaceae bacterium]|nr:hypothetical protein [Tannerellaceae bacterium]
YTLVDYFTLGMYKGEIIKVQSPANKTLRQLYSDTDSLRIAQEEIERELDTFKKSLSWSPDSVKVSKKQIKTEQSHTSGNLSKPARKEERPVPTRSVRRR